MGLSGPSGLNGPNGLGRRHGGLTLRAAMLSLVLASGPGLAQDLPGLGRQLERKAAAGTLAFEADVKPALEALKRDGTDRQRLQLLKLLVDMAEADAPGTPALRQSLKASLPAAVLEFASNPAHAADLRDSALMLLRGLDADAASLQAGIQLAEAEHARGRPHFGNTARLLKLHLERRAGTGPTSVAQARQDARPEAPPRAAARQPANFHASMVNAQRAMTEGRHADVLALVQPLEAQLLKEDAGYTEKVKWAWLFEFKRFALYELGRVPEALQTCTLATQRLAGNDWPYLTDFNVVRATRRACHNMLAWHGQERARSLAELAGAIEHIDACFDTVSPIEDDDVLDNFHETRLRVYLKAAAWDARAHTPALHQALFDAEQREVKLPADLPGLAALQRSPGYQTFRKQQPR